MIGDKTPQLIRQGYLAPSFKELLSDDHLFTMQASDWMLIYKDGKVATFKLQYGEQSVLSSLP